MRVFVTGATGAIGGHVVPALVAAGVQVTALARTPGKAAALTARGATPSAVSLFDRAALADALAGHDAVANLATAIPSPRTFLRASAWRANERVRREGSAAVAAAARQAGVPRLVQESITFLYPSRGAEWIDEDVVPDPFPLAEVNLAAEASARTHGDGVVLRFGLFYGPGSTHTDLMLGLARRHVAFVAGAPQDFLSSLHLADAAAAVVAALEAPAGTYNVVDDEPVTRSAYAAALGAAVGVRPWLALPGRAARLAGGQAESLVRSQRVANGRFREATGWSPRYRSVREGLRAA
ncbi:NAD-dependent epimerase/dehydratase family protein [Geodermatophilus maliterrae]|uniref:NAD-dependent epimerase/dehydratase family protein n=1 Tax=Geodermatophilus maliterrae TaxID=3162531 RepID=A0ABV3XDP6_9ACTN